jgi:hypothetical protein
LSELFSNIPLELQSRPQWMGWQLVEREGLKPTKPPFNARTGMRGSVTNPRDWSTFVEAVAAIKKFGLTGIGFVFTENDDYAGIDLDETHDDPNAYARQIDIFKNFNSYSELSPSGKGLHIIIKAKLPGGGRRRASVELYDNARFFTMTGNVHENHFVIENRQHLADVLYAELGGAPDAAFAPIEDRPQTRTDGEVIASACDALNGNKFKKLLAGEWAELYPSQSEADFAFVDILAFYTQNRAQIARMFRASILGQAPKDNYRHRGDRHAYVGQMIGKSLDRQAELVPAATAFANNFRAGVTSQPRSNLVGIKDFLSASVSPKYLWHRILQMGCLYALTGMWGAGKSAIAITIALHAAIGRNLCGHRILQVRVLFLCGENPDDVKLRILAACAWFGIDPTEIDDYLFLTLRPFSIDAEAALQHFVNEAALRGPFGLCIVDTGPAHSSANDENDNRQQHALAMALRVLMAALGNPATVVLMHPAKGATRETMAPRGGGSFSGSIDGELYAWNENGIVEFGHRAKFRGPGFAPLQFRLERHEFPEITDNFGERAISVIAVPTDERPTKSKPALSPANRIALDALAACRAEAIPPPPAVLAQLPTCKGAPLCPPAAVVPESVWRRRCYDQNISGGLQAAKAAAFTRARGALLAQGLICARADYVWLPTWLSDSLSGTPEPGEVPML